MDVSNSAGNMQRLIKQLEKDFPAISFARADVFSWSPSDKTIFFVQGTKKGAWSLLHEMGHMLRAHISYDSDVELLHMEIEAWETAKQLAIKYGHDIDKDHIEQCIDSYRDWLHQRSTCIVCSQIGLEQVDGRYLCINCSHTWRVGHDRFCRVYRKKIEPRMSEAL